MRVGYIDSASIYEIVNLTRHDQSRAAYPWAWRHTLEVTIALLNTRHFRMAPTPGSYGAASGPYEQLTAGIGDIVDLRTPAPPEGRLALKKTKAWLARNHSRVLSQYERLCADQGNFQPWLEQFIRHAWPEHAARLGGLFNAEFIPELAGLLNVSRLELERLLLLSQSTTEIERLARVQPDEEAFILLRDASCFSALIRGIYHDYVAAQSSLQIMHHAMRHDLLPSLRGHSRTHIPIENTRLYFASILVQGALREVSQEARIACWLENLALARPPVLGNSVDLSPRDYDGRALEIAVRAAQEVGIRTHAKVVEIAADVALTIGTSALTYFTLVGWQGAAVGAVGGVLLSAMGISKRLVSRVSNRTNRLRDLAKLGAGRLERTWR